MEDPNENALQNSLQANAAEDVPVQSINQKTPPVTPQRSQEVASEPLIPESVGGTKGILDDLNPELMAKIVAEVTKKLKGSESKGGKQGNKFFDRVAKRNPKTYDGKEDPMLLEEWVRQMEKIFDVVEVPDDRRINIGAFYLTGHADIWWGMVKPTFQNSEAT